MFSEATFSRAGRAVDSLRCGKSDIRIAALSSSATGFSFVSMLVLAVGLDSAGRRQLALLAPTALFQSVLEAGVVYEFRDKQRTILTGLYGRLAICTIFLVVS